MALLRVGQGGTIRLDAEFRDGTGRLQDADQVRVDILDVSGISVVTDAVPVRAALGLFYYDFSVGALAPLGIWTAHWTGVVNSVAVAGDDQFEVVDAGSIQFGRTTLVTPGDVEEMIGRPLTAAESARVGVLARAAQAQIEAYLNRPVTVREFVENYVAEANGNIYFRHTPVQTILEVTQVGGSLALSMPLGQWQAASWGLHLPGAYGPYRVRYRAGYDSPEWAFTMALTAIGQEITHAAEGEESMLGVRRIRVEDYEVQWDPAVVTGGAGGSVQLLAPPALSSISRYKRRAFG